MLLHPDHAGIVFWLVIYVRIAEFSLFRRGPIQWLMTPVSRLLHGVSTWALVAAAVMPLPAYLITLFTLCPSV